ncbi:AraC family transcriptional regulator [Fibrisoma montanum]|uniref:AraC family transcriptional regulator n=1 Tax=Fibrisoma montanum TaxID=2305895 RepID=A0A418LXB7_9BACT|nr:helix-turn-helix transcriptional regulator [Fibrisoma montanum]RIV17914.1 AraC family transcriptional regulator [Fibrisoma montanum]
MTKHQNIADFAPSQAATSPPVSGTIAVIRLDDLSAESVAATAVYTRKDFYKISLITGHATYHYRDQSYRVEPGQCALVFTNQETPYRWEVHSGSCSGYACLFTADFLPMHTHLRPANLLVFDADRQSVYQLAPQEKETFTALFLKMLAEQDSDYVGKHQLLFLYVLECIHQALKLQPESDIRKQTAATRLTESFKTLLAGQFPLVTPFQPIRLRSPQAFAQELAVHPNYLNQVLKTVTGRTTTQLIAERLMQEARALLMHSNWSISQISNSLGFEEPTHFTKAFRSHTRQTPSSFRQTS